jgi:hypothetical protein
VPALKGVRW